MNTNVDLWDDNGLLFEDISQYRRLVGKLIYLTVKRPDITYVVRLVNQFMLKSRGIHWKTVLRILTYTKNLQVTVKGCYLKSMAFAA